MVQIQRPAWLVDINSVWRLHCSFLNQRTQENSSECQFNFWINTMIKLYFPFVGFCSFSRYPYDFTHLAVFIAQAGHEVMILLPQPAKFLELYMSARTDYYCSEF